jgi:hypothetical protein
MKYLSGCSASMGRLLQCLLRQKVGRLILPLLLCSELIHGKHMVMKVDNISYYYGWQSNHILGNGIAYILVRTLLVLSAFLSCCVHVEHLPRMAFWNAIVCNNLSRR